MKQLKIQDSLGITLIEVLVVIAIVGILAAIAVPSYQDTIERNRLKQAAESLADDLKFARTEAIKRSADVTLTLTAGWSYTITAGGNTLKIVDGSQFQGIALNAADSVIFSFRRGTPDAAKQPILSSTHYQAAVDVNDIGKAVICTPAGQTGLPSYSGC